MVSGGEKEKKENMWSGEKEKNREGKGEYIWRRNIFVLQRRRRTVKEKEENFWRREILGRRREMRIENELSWREKSLMGRWT